jgi:hypothetical protein
LKFHHFKYGCQNIYVTYHLQVHTFCLLLLHTDYKFSQESLIFKSTFGKLTFFLQLQETNFITFLVRDNNMASLNILNPTCSPCVFLYI